MMRILWPSMQNGKQCNQHHDSSFKNQYICPREDVIKVHVFLAVGLLYMPSKKEGVEKIKVNQCSRGSSLWIKRVRQSIPLHVKIIVLMMSGTC